MPLPKRDTTNRMFRGNELARLMSMIVMLLVLVAIMQKAANPTTWEIFAKKEPVRRVEPKNKVEDKSAEQLAEQSGGKRKAESGKPLALGTATAATSISARDQLAAAPTAERPLPAETGLARTSTNEPVPETTSQDRPAAQEPAADNRPATATTTVQAGEQVPAKSDAGGTPAKTDAPPAQAAATTPAAENSAGQRTGAEKPAAAPAEDNGSLNKPTPGTKENDFAPLPTTPGTSGEPVVKSALEPTGPTDEDPDEWEIFKKFEFEAILDGTLGMEKPDMGGYKRLLAWTKNQSDELLRRRAQNNLVYAQFFQDPDKFRGKLVHLDLNVRRAVEAKVSREELGVDTVYEFWGSNQESRGKFYCIVTADPPVGMPLGSSINEHIHFDGYFFKLQGYLPASSKPNDKPSKAPMFIGRFSHVVTPAKPLVDRDAYLWWGVSGLLGLFAIVRVGLMLMPKRHSALLSETSSALGSRGEQVDLDSWLDQAEDRALDDSSRNGSDLDARGNNLDDSDEFYSGGSSNDSLDADRIRRWGK